MIPELEEIKRLLWEEWDPIGVSGPDWPNDEYDSYAFQAFVKLKGGANVSEIEAYLDWADSENMGLSGRPGRNGTIAQKIIDLRKTND